VRRCLGRSRGGWGTKLHAAVTGDGQPLHLLLTPGQSGDSPQAEALLAGLEPQYVLADAGYDSNAIRERICENHGTACIRPNPTRRVEPHYDKQRYKNRNVIERFFGFIKHFRRVATRYEKKAENFLGFIWLAAVLVSLKSIVHTT